MHFHIIIKPSPDYRQRAHKIIHRTYPLFNSIILDNPYKSNVQPFNSWFETFRFCTVLRQVSRLKDHRIRHLPSFPVISRLLLPNYGDEFVQDLHLFPFSPEPTRIYDTAKLPRIAPTPYILHIQFMR